MPITTGAPRSLAFFIVCHDETELDGPCAVVFAARRYRAAGAAGAAVGSQVRWRLQVSPAAQGGLHWGTQAPAWQAKPGEQMGVHRSAAFAAGELEADGGAAAVR